MSVEIFSLIFKRRNFAGSLIGGIAETQEMLDFCAAHNITADVEVIPIQKINEAYDRMLRSDVKYRFRYELAEADGVSNQWIISSIVRTKAVPSYGFIRNVPSRGNISVPI
jgi:alcohol dehydrogenase (NADP+)